MALAENLVMVTLVGAAVANGTEDQRQAVRDRILPAIADHSIPYSEVRRILRDIMGPDWHPTGDWADQIAAFGGIPR